MEFRWFPTAAENRARGAAASKAFGGALIALAALLALGVIARMLARSIHGDPQPAPWLLLIATALIAGVGELFWISGRMEELKTSRGAGSKNHPPAV